MVCAYNLYCENLIGDSFEYLPVEIKENPMSETLEIKDTPVFSYALASADMRYIEVGEREIYLRDDLNSGLIFRGEIPGCGPDYFVELNEILLEYAMSCEGCREDRIASQEVIRFGEHLGEALAARTYQKAAEWKESEKLSSVFNCVLNSMSAKFIEEIKVDQIEYSLECCPLSECARDTGFNRSVEMAGLSFIALCNTLITALASDWKLIQPIVDETYIPIHKIIIDGP
jgi:hypothetical protein